jgi:hypothetical protein
MTDRLQPPLNSSLGKRKSDGDLSKEAGTSKESVVERKKDWVHIEIRKRSRYYCCQCEKEQRLRKTGACVVCGHKPIACLDCLAIRSK